MESFNLHIKNMVCPRCLWVVREELIKMGANIVKIELGHANIILHENNSLDKIEKKLNEYGFELLNDKDEIIINQIRKAVQNYVSCLESKNMEILLSDYLVKEVGKNYNYLSKLFSQIESTTIENYYINLKISRVKELLDYGEYNLSEIAAILGYSSVQYLSSQFKGITGMSVSEYKFNINRLVSNYNSIAEALKELKDLGYIYYFHRANNKIQCKELQIDYDLNDLDLNEIYRFKESSSIKGNSVLYSVEANGGVKGVYVES